MFDKCPGANSIRTPKLKVKKCPECGGDVEIFSTDLQVQCPTCGHAVFDNLQSCITWCKYAKECVGEDLYERLTKKGPETE
jgi:NADH pyrophosphatase NudC (nudix superfamily)